MRVKRLWGNRPGGKRLGAKRLREEMGLGRNDPDSLGCPSYIRKLVVPFAVFLLPLQTKGLAAGHHKSKMATSNGKPHFNDSGEHFRDGKPCRACTDVKTWLKMTRNEKKRKEV